MAFYSTQRAVSDGTLVLLPISIEYFDRSEITVFFDDLPTTEGVDWNWVGSTDHTLSFPSPGVPNGVDVRVERNTDISDVRHIFVDGAAFLDETMDENFRQVLHVVQEAKEHLGLSDLFNDLNMHRHRIRNIGTAVDDTDAISLAQYRADADGAWTARAQAVVAKDASVVAKDASVRAKTAALASENKANEWAEKTSGPVEGSAYSAKYWAEQAAASTSGQFYEGSNTVTVHKTIVNGNNAMTPGPITVANGPSVVVESGAVWTIV